VKEFLSRKGVKYIERDVRQDPSAIDELRRLGAMATPVTTLEDEFVIGLDEGRLNALVAKLSETV